MSEEDNSCTGSVEETAAEMASEQDEVDEAARKARRALGLE